MTFDMEHLRVLYAPDPQRVALARARQAAVFRGERPDAWPAHLPGTLTPDQEAIPAPDFKEAFDDIDLMVCSQVRGACAGANGNSDIVPSSRGNYGTGVLLSCLGLEQEVFPDKMPWLKRHLTREEAAALTFDDIAPRGTFARGLDFMRRHKDLMGDTLPLYCMDTQGPFDLAHLLLGDDIFLLIYDDPPLLHHVLEICLELGKRTHEWMKAVSGEPRGVCHHSGALYAENFGIRICEDTTAIVGREVMETFALPYTRRLAQYFDGAWVHYCGRSDVLTELALQIPEVKAINFGLIPGHEHDHPFEVDMQRVAEAGKVYWGWWPRRDGESVPEYLRRLHGWAAQGCLIPMLHPVLDSDNPLTPEQVLDTWYSL
ncbi:MAG: hypothetical protein JW951_03070 [Lentisphaerae bacterium]|nr:hypothetical protein [Lentisphaerota bacterium]